MTIPIVPGPFSFLEGAGEAAGAYAKAKEERQHHAEQIAEHGSNFIMQSILQGADPSVLDNPDVQKMMKTAYGFTFPSSVGRALGAEARHKAKGFTAAEDAGVPKAQAGADLATANLTAQRANAESTTGVPEQDALTKLAVAKAQATGAQLNQNIFKGAISLLGTDPKFAHLAAEAATGVLDARLRYLEFSRANLSLERQKMVDNANILLSAMKEGSGQYDKAMKEWETGMQPWLQEHGDTPESRKAYADANPMPDQDKITGDYIQSTFGFDKAEYQRRLGQVMSVLLPPGAKDTKANQTSGTAQPSGTTTTQAQIPGTAKVQQVIMAITPQYDPANAGLKIAQAVQSEQLTDLEAAAIVAHLRKTMPGDWFKKFNDSYKLGPKP